MGKKRNKFVDAHNHLTQEFYPEWVIDEIIDQAQLHNIEFMIVNGSSRKRNLEVIELAKKHSIVKAAIGIHPEDLQHEDDYKLVEELICPEIVGIGEIGLDYYYQEGPNRELQLKALENQLKLAQKHNLPVVMHIRDKEGSWEAYQDAFDLLSKYKVRSMLHTFAGNLEWAQKFMQLDTYFSFSGVVTFGSSEETRKVIDFLPVERILTETDAPYLRVHPYSGQKNEPNTVLFVAYYIAGLKKIGMDKFVDRVNRNLRNLFKL
ncbi:TatD family hydrolase [Mycoplasmopsis sturni]|uniref:TatD family hydrolase n=1 Tax=Mycoplasmopsis sturni TaxID=39047 RepID=UPI00055D3B86|nr:TatD family hydrolase [Mycoplasmopsis sturni]